MPTSFIITDPTKAGKLSVVIDGVPVTVSYDPHNKKVCACADCKAIREKAAKEAAEKKRANGERFIAHLYGLSHCNHSNSHHHNQNHCCHHHHHTQNHCHHHHH